MKEAEPVAQTSFKENSPRNHIFLILVPYAVTAAYTSGNAKEGTAKQVIAGILFLL